MFSSHYSFFHAALKTERVRQKKQQKELAIDAGVAESYISEIIHKKKKASQDLQEKIASLFGYSLLDFLILGRTIVENKKLSLSESPPIYISGCAPKLLPGPPDTEKRHRQTDSREGILSLFQDKERARTIILNLWEIEKRDPDKLEMVGGYLKGVLDGMPLKKTAREA